MRRAESDLLDLGEIVVRVSVEGEGTDVLDGDHIFGNELGGVQQIKIELDIR